MKTIFELHHTLRQSREELAFRYAGLKEELNFSNRLRHSIKNHPWSWICGATAVGFSLIFLNAPQRGRKKSLKTFSQPSSMEEGTFFSKKGKLLKTALSLLNNHVVRAELFSIAGFLFPLAREAVTTYLHRRQQPHPQDKR